MSNHNCEEYLLAKVMSMLEEQVAAGEVTLPSSAADCPNCELELAASELVQQLLKRSCCEAAPETLKMRIRAQFIELQ